MSAAAITDYYDGKLARSRRAGSVCSSPSHSSHHRMRVATGLLYGARFGNGNYELYFFFPLTQMQIQLGVILRTLALVGLALVFLLAGIAWLLTRWVVVPVARAAHGAQLLATGNLDERLDVRGNDEVAALATSFNEMAASLQDKMRELEELSQVQRQFVSDVSHELRTPLTTIRMAADLLYESRDELEPQAKRTRSLCRCRGWMTCRNPRPRCRRVNLVS